MRNKETQREEMKPRRKRCSQKEKKVYKEGEETLYQEGEEGEETLYQEGEEGEETLYQEGKEGEETLYQEGEEGEETLHQEGEEGEETLYQEGEEGEETLHQEGEEGEETLYQEGEEGEETLHQEGEETARKQDEADSIRRVSRDCTSRMRRSQEDDRLQRNGLDKIRRSGQMDTWTHGNSHSSVIPPTAFRGV